jgi:hypothetical protein
MNESSDFWNNVLNHPDTPWDSLMAIAFGSKPWEPGWENSETKQCWKRVACFFRELAENEEMPKENH